MGEGVTEQRAVAQGKFHGIRCTPFARSRQSARR
jgi:hypothetical protein